MEAACPLVSCTLLMGLGTGAVTQRDGEAHARPLGAPKGGPSPSWVPACPLRALWGLAESAASPCECSPHTLQLEHEISLEQPRGWFYH